MSRLTEKYGKYGRPYCFNCKEEVRIDNDIVRQMLYKLGKLEDLEEELGCPLEVLYKTQKKGYIYARNKKKYVNAIILNRKNKYIIVSDDELGMINRFDVSLSNYKKTWWLKKDKSE